MKESAKLQAIWRKAQKDNGISIPLSVRQPIDQAVEGLNPPQCKRIINLAARSIKLSAEYELLPNPKKQKKSPHKAQRGPNPRITKKRLELYNWVMNKHLSRRNCLNSSRVPKKEYKWKDWAKDWDKDYPSNDPMTANRLKWAFNNAKNSKEVMRLYRDQFIDKEAIKIQQEYNEFLNLIIQGAFDRTAYMMGGPEGQYHALCQIQELLPDKYKDKVEVWKNADEFNRAQEDDSRKSNISPISIVPMTYVVPGLQKDSEEAKR